jgi:hypothetical protein
LIFDFASAWCFDAWKASQLRNLFILHQTDHVAVDGGSSDDDDEDLEGLLEDADETLEEIIQRCDADQVKAIIQKRIDMGRILSAAAAKISGEDDSEDEDSDEDEESDDEEEEEEGENGVPSSADEAGPAITNGQDVKTFKQVKLEHLVHAADSEEGQVQDSHSASEPNGSKFRPKLLE